MNDAPSILLIPLPSSVALTHVIAVVTVWITALWCRKMQPGELLVALSLPLSLQISDILLLYLYLYSCRLAGNADQEKFSPEAFGVRASVFLCST